MKENLPYIYLEKNEIKEYNSRILSLMSDYLNFYPCIVKSEDVETVSAECGVSKEYAFALLLASAFGLDPEGEEKAFFRDYFLPMINELDTEDFKKDLYRKNIKLREAAFGRWRITTKKLFSCEAFVCNDFKVEADGRVIPQIGFFTEEYGYPAILENGREWMTLMPNETVTTRSAIERAHGRVLTFGLGLGYFSYMAAMKSEVESVTAVELSADAIKLFEDEILPQFSCGDKIKVVNADAFEFAENEMAKGNFDFVFCDIWHDVGDGRELYLKMKEYERFSPHSEFAYWIEDSIKCYL